MLREIEFEKFLVREMDVEVGNRSKYDAVIGNGQVVCALF